MNSVSNLLRFNEKLAMKRLLIFMLAFICQNQVFASEEQKAETHVEFIREGISSDYSEFSYVTVLVDNPSNFDRNKAFLAIDQNGKPAVYPIIERQHRCKKLDRHSLTDILEHWTPAKVEDNVHSFAFSYWKNETWKPARVDLKFRENYCSQFRVVSNDTKMQIWLPTEAIPAEMDHPSTSGKLKLPFFACLVEGPRDMPDCSSRPITDRYLKVHRNGKCRLGI